MNTDKNKSFIREKREGREKVKSRTYELNGFFAFFAFFADSLFSF